jgi:PAS domain S-box-containing protein
MNEEKKNALLVKAFGEITYVHTVKNNEILWDGKIMEILGYNKEEMGFDEKSWLDKVHPDDLHDVQETFTKAEKGNQIYKGTYRFRKKNGDYLWVQDTGFMEIDEQGKAVIVVGVLKDIDNETNMENQIQKILSSTLNAVYIYNTEKNINDYINKQYTAMTGWTLDEINGMGEDFLKLFHPDDLNHVLKHMNDIIKDKDNNVYELEYRFKHKNGKWIWCLSHDVVFERTTTGDVKSFLGSFIDITNTKELQQKLSEKNEELEKINNFMVNRELKMTELKEQIKKLESQNK